MSENRIDFEELTKKKSSMNAVISGVTTQLNMVREKTDESDPEKETGEIIFRKRTGHRSQIPKLSGEQRREKVETDIKNEVIISAEGEKLIDDDDSKSMLSIRQGSLEEMPDAVQKNYLSDRAKEFEESDEEEEAPQQLKVTTFDIRGLETFWRVAQAFVADNADGKSPTFMALRKVLLKVDSAMLINQMVDGRFELNDGNYAQYLEIYQAVSAYVADHVSSWSTATKERYEKASLLKAMLDRVSRSAVALNADDQVEQDIVCSTEEKDAAVKNVEKQLVYYREYCRRVDADPIASDEEKLSRKWDAMKIFERDVQIYIHVKEAEAVERQRTLKGADAYLAQEYRSLKMQMRLRDITKRCGFVSAFKNDTSQMVRDHSYSMLSEGLKKQRQKNSSMDQDEGLTPEQIKAINIIDEWVIRNVRNRNVTSPFSSQNRVDIAAKLMSMSRRKRLYIYYLVETRDRVEQSKEGIFLSQNQGTYKPTLSGFKKQMIATRWKFYKRIARDNIYWEKLTQSMLIADQAAPVINLVAKYMRPELKKEPLEKDENKGQAEKDAILDEQDKELRAMQQIKDDLVKFALNGQKAMQLTKELEKAKGAEKANKENELRDLKAEADEIIDDMCETARIASEKKGKSLREQTNKEAGRHYGNVLLGDTQKTLAIVGNALKDAKVFEGVAESATQLRQITQGYGQGLNVLGGISATVGACYALAAILDSPNSTTGWDALNLCLTFSTGVVKTAASTMTFVNAITQVSEVIGEAVPAIAVTFAGCETANALIKTGSAARNGYHRYSASKLVEKRRNMLRQQGKELEADKYRDGMLKLNRKLSQREGIAATGSVVTAGLSLTAAGLVMAGAATVGATAIIGGVILVVALALRAVDRAYSGSMKDELFDAFFEIPDLYKKVKENWTAKNGGTPPTKDQEKALLKSLRERVAAERGFFSPEQAAVHIANIYADYILYRANGNFDDTQMYREMIQGLGLNYVKVSGTPTKSDIVKKLCR